MSALSSRRPKTIWLVFLSGFWAPTSLFTLVALSITVFICVGYTCFGHFKYLSPHNYEVSAAPAHTRARFLIFRFHVLILCLLSRLL